MAKTIKFNLISDGHPVRTLDDLREHFSIEDVLDHHKSGMLARWLEVRGYEKELTAVNSVPVEDKVNAAKALVKVFEVEMDNTKVEEIGYILQYEDQRKEAEKRYSERHDEKMGQLKASLSCYQNLKTQMAAHRDNFSALKADVAELHTEYMTAFELDYRSLFYYLKENAPAAIYMMLAYDGFRKKYIPAKTPSASSGDRTDVTDDDLLGKEVDLLFEKINMGSTYRSEFMQAVKDNEKKTSLARRLVRYNTNDPTNVSRKVAANVSAFGKGAYGSLLAASQSTKDLTNDMALVAVTEFLDRLHPNKTESVATDTAEVFETLCGMTTNQNLKSIFEGKYDRFRVIKRNTHGNWDDMIDKKEKCMVLWMAEKCEVRPSGCRDICYKAGDVKNQFMLLDGIDYRSQLGTAELLVLEV